MINSVCVNSTSVKLIPRNGSCDQVLEGLYISVKAWDIVLSTSPYIFSLTAKLKVSYTTAPLFIKGWLFQFSVGAYIKLKASVPSSERIEVVEESPDVSNPIVPWICEVSVISI